jgi:hypothetical protein
MKKKLGVLIMLMMLIQIGIATQASVLPTSLSLTIVDRLGNRVEGATVTVYKAKDDYINQTNPITDGISNDRGKLTFKKMKPIPYYLDARKGDMHNDGMGAKTETLKEGKTNKVIVVIH